jgi:Fe-S oxidoreductase
MGFDLRRKIPQIHRPVIRKWFRHTVPLTKNTVCHDIGKLFLFVDEFTNYHDKNIGMATISLLQRLGYNIEIATHKESGRTFISKGLLRKVQKIADYNVDLFRRLVSEEVPLVGIEPSCILSFRDEYPELVSPALREDARKLAPNTMTIEEFIVGERRLGRIQSSPRIFIYLDSPIILTTYKL